MALSDVQIRCLKPADKLYKITDEKGLYLEISPNGSKLWRYKYLYMGKNKRIALGRYPEVVRAASCLNRCLMHCVTN